MRRIPLGSGALAAPFFFFNDTATTEIYTLSLHDALPISLRDLSGADARLVVAQTLRAGDDELACRVARGDLVQQVRQGRSEEHTSELQSLAYLVCRLLLEKKKTTHESREVHTERPDQHGL